MNEASKKEVPRFISRLEWAQHLRRVGFRILPIRPGTKRPYQPWKMWEEEQSEEMIQNHWLKNPEDDIGIFTNGLYVLDADHPASQIALNEIKRRHGLRALISVKTRKGVHDYFALPPGVQASQDSHSTEGHPERIDVKTGRSYIIGPGSTDKSVLTWEVEHASQLTAATKEFVEEVERHNGRTRRADEQDVEKSAPLGDAAVPRLRELLDHISPDVGYLDWTKVGMAIFRETNGSDTGLGLYDAWSKGGSTYKGIREIEAKWRSFSKSVSNPVTMGTLIHMAQQSGTFVQSRPEPDAWFDRVLVDEGYVAVDGRVTPESIEAQNPFANTSLIHYHDQMAKEIQAQEPFLGNLGMLGHSIVFYAAPNTGKTLITLNLLLGSVKRGDVSGERVHYINADDSGAGLLEKSLLCAAHGVKMYGDGYNGFKISNFVPWIKTLVEKKQAKGKVFILDTLTRVFDTNSKKESREFTALIRSFTSQGGTFIGLGHTRKNPGPDGEPMYLGTSDLINDLDTAYMIVEVGQNANNETKTVEFRFKKRRGDVRAKAAFRYSIKSTQTYAELLQSVRSADSEEVAAMERIADAKRDSKIVAIIQSHIRRGICKKMELCKAVVEAAGVPRAKVETILAKYAGTTQGTHHWDFDVKARGAHVYKLLPAPACSSPVSQVPSSQVPQPPRATPHADPFVPYPDELDPQQGIEASSELEDVRF